MKLTGLLGVMLPLLALADPNNAWVTIRTEDADTGEPVSNLAVVAAFQIDNGTSKRKPRPMLKEGLTGADGCRTFSGFTNLGGVMCELATPLAGYYPVYKRLRKFADRDEAGLWQPNPLVITMQLQRVMHPIPLRVRRASADFGEDNRLQYDFMAGDWLPPQGQGKVADLELVRDDWDIKLRFPNPADGIQEIFSDPWNHLRLRTAPESGYKAKMRRKRAPVEYFRTFGFRVRTELDANGQPVTAYYGKIYEDIQPKIKNGTAFTRCSLGGVTILYYLNPTALDRNLEWNLRDNLESQPALGKDRQP